MSVSNYSLMLTAVDFSAESETLIDRAAQLRAQCGARLCLLHVVEYLPMAYSGDLVLPEGFDLRARRDAAENDRGAERQVPSVRAEALVDLEG